MSDTCARCGENRDRILGVALMETFGARSSPSSKDLLKCRKSPTKRHDYSEPVVEQVKE